MDRSTDDIAVVIPTESDESTGFEELDCSVDSESISGITSADAVTSLPKSILSTLQAPRLSEITRKRRVRTNPPKGKPRSCSRGLCDPKSVRPAQRVKEHPEEELTVSNGKLFCRACREELSLKSTVVNNHIKSVKHTEGKEKLKTKEKKERDIASALAVHNRETHQEGESLPVDQQIYRVKVVTAFLKAGVPVNKVTCFRQILEESGYRLTDRSHVANFIPFVV